MVKKNFAQDNNLKVPNYELNTANSYAVKVLRLDTLELFENIEFIKVDIEGMELEFFKGAMQTISENSFPPIFYERIPDVWFQDRADILDKYLIGLGYYLTPIGSDVIAQHKTRPQYLKCDVGDNKISFEMTKVK
jgi:hypothetical protein